MTMRLLVAVIASTIVVLSAPFMGQIRGALRSAFPGQFVWIVGGSVAAAIGVAMIVAFARIRHRRALRFAAIGLAFAIGVAYTQVMATGIPEVDAVERVHFVEYGLIALLFYRVWRDAGDPSVVVLPLLWGLAVGTFDEWLQWFIPNRVGEARDVFLNLVALGCGLMFGFAVDPPHAFVWRLRPGSWGRVGMTAAGAWFVFASFYSTVHLGYTIQAEGIGRFSSRYTNGQLEGLMQDRAERWRTNPPTVLRRLSREDQYMDEGLWHVRRRNEHWDEGNVASAWSENLILERFFVPVLDSPSYVSPNGNRWPAEHRADAQNRTGPVDGSFVSDAEPYPIVTLPKLWFWLMGTAAALAIAVASVVHERRSRAARSAM